jgi:hypothetical protein
MVGGAGVLMVSIALVWDQHGGGGKSGEWVGGSLTLSEIEVRPRRWSSVAAARYE